MNDAVCDSSSPALTGGQSAHTEEIGQVRKHLALALYEAGAYCGNCEYDGWGSCDDCREVVYRYVDALGLEQVGWLVLEEPEDFNSWIAVVDLDFEDLAHYPHRPLFTAAPPSPSGSEVSDGT